MKINGKTIQGPNEVITIVTRQTGDLVFKARAILDYMKFDELCKVPTAPFKKMPDGTTFPDFDDKDYKVRIRTYSERKVGYMIIESLSATPGLEFDTIKINDPTSWENIEKEFKTAGLTEVEIQRVIASVWDANGLDNQKIEEAKNRFLASQLVVAK